MSYIYQQRKQPQGPQNTAPERANAPGPGFSSPNPGASIPPAGPSFDLAGAMQARMADTSGAGRRQTEQQLKTPVHLRCAGVSVCENLLQDQAEAKGDDDQDGPPVVPRNLGSGAQLRRQKHDEGKAPGGALPPAGR